ncbi:MAG: SDR family oxidoreductase [Allobaculum sp.]|nr:SDR family oxidoreductase [Allobaculum sp.]
MSKNELFLPTLCIGKQHPAKIIMSDFTYSQCDNIGYNPFSLCRKEILIIGGTSNLEKSIIDQLINNGASSIIVIDKNIESDHRFMSLDVNIYTPEGIESAIKHLQSENRSFNGVIFTKTESDFRPIKMTSAKLACEIMNSNYLIFMEFMRLLLKRKMLVNGASVVAMSSISSIHAMKAKAAFAAAKAALDSAVRCIACELADKGIRVNSIQKGGVDADMTKSHIQAVSELNNGDEAKRQPLGLVKAKEIGNLISFLLSDACTSITGTSIVIDGGYLL